MFNFLRRRPVLHNAMSSPMSGEIASIMSIPDEVFSDKILGDGFCVIPTDGEIKSPVSGEISQVADTLHCWCIKSNDGLEILLHVGVDTVNLKGKAFKSFVKVGKKVRAGDLIGSADLAMIKEKGFPLHTAIVITNMSKIKKLTPKFCEDAKSGYTIALEYELTK